ncbi:probable terpene synthase 2 [Prosopis cineraria]|uniref:probable terpene synthase 2 n=1 Tax=Prosopis cineraria TaxID=364024 RepID=UPI00240EB52B|nr:probable terpene synthase 2 [Prosopis cineraria]
MSVTASHHDNTRRCANFTPDIWGNMFLQYASESEDVDDSVEHKVHKEKLKMFISSNHQSRSEILNFIELVKRLGVSYHFEQEIEGALAKIHSMYTSNNILIMHQDGDDDLHSLALLFRLLRQHGYPISSDVFERFKDGKGEFNINQNLAKDVKGMLALYEAAQLEVHGENIFDEALHFTYTLLKSLTDNNQLSPILNTTARSFPKSHDNVAQLCKARFQYVAETASKRAWWWKESEFTRKVPYVRDRLVESYLWALSLSNELQFSIARMLVGKLVATIALLDDTYDVYGKLEELEPFTEAVHRWDIGLIKSLPEGMKVVFEAVIELCSEMEMQNGAMNTTFQVMRCTRIIKGAVSTTCPLLISSFLGLGNLATKKAFEWLATHPKIIRTMSTIGRLLDDMASHNFEQEREHVASGVECCMKQFGVSEEEAHKMLNDDIKNCWKDINEECLNNPQNVLKSVLDCVVNLARAAEVFYENKQDRFTNVSPIIFMFRFLLLSSREPSINLHLLLAFSILIQLLAFIVSSPRVCCHNKFVEDSTVSFPLFRAANRSPLLVQLIRPLIIYIAGHCSSLLLFVQQFLLLLASHVRGAISFIFPYRLASTRATTFHD